MTGGQDAQEFDVVRRTIYKTRWECLRPGLWRSECGWYTVQRVDRRLWVGTRLDEDSRDLFADSLVSCVWATLGLTVEKWKAIQ